MFKKQSNVAEVWYKKVEGRGKPLFLLHGWGQTHESLLPLAELLTCSAQPYLFDLPGFGHSPPPQTAWGAFDYADQIVQNMESLGVEKTSLIGHSFGGKVALCMAIRYPEKIEKVALIAPSGISPRRSFSKKIRLASIKLAAKTLRKWDQYWGTGWFASEFAPRFGSNDYRHAGVLRPTLIRSVNEDLSPFLHSIKSPVLMFWGEQDTETPLEMGERLSKLIPDSHLCRLPWHDHHPFNDVGAHLLAYHLRRFLKEPEELR